MLPQKMKKSDELNLMNCSTALMSSLAERPKELLPLEPSQAFDLPIIVLLST
jgi:hypothetical protein